MLEDRLSETEQCALLILFNISNSSMTIDYTVNIPDIKSSTSLSSPTLSSIITNLYLMASDLYATFLSASKPLLCQTLLLFPLPILRQPTLYPQSSQRQRRSTNQLCRKFGQSSRTFPINFVSFETSLVTRLKTC